MDVRQLIAVDAVVDVVRDGLLQPVEAANPECAARVKLVAVLLKPSGSFTQRLDGTHEVVRRGADAEWDHVAFL